MIEAILYFCLGAAVMMLISLFIISAVRRRTERLTMHKMHASIPLAMPEIQAEKDQMRAEFALATKRLEISIEHMRERAGMQLEEISEKSEQIARLLDRLNHHKRESEEFDKERKALSRELSDVRKNLYEFINKSENYSQQLHSLQSQHESLQDRIRATSSELKDMQIENVKLRETKTKLHSQFEEQQVLTSNLKLKLKETEKRLRMSEGTLSRREVKLVKLDEGNQLLRRQIADLEERIASQFKYQGEGKPKSNIGEDYPTSSLRDWEKLRAELDNKSREHRELENQHLELNTEFHAIKNAHDELTLEHSQLLEELEHYKEELSNTQISAKAGWGDERISSAKIREQINDMAAEITQIALQIEGENGKISSMLKSVNTEIDDADKKNSALFPSSMEDEASSSLSDNKLDANVPQTSELLSRIEKIQNLNKTNE